MLDLLVSYSHWPLFANLGETTYANKGIIHAFVSSRLDYCNSLLVWVADCVIQKLQRVQNAVARMTGTHKCNHVTLILRELHWLPIAQRIQYKIVMLVNKYLRGLAPPYLAELSRTSTPAVIRLRKTRCATDSHSHWSQELCCFGPETWNSLPAELRLSTPSDHVWKCISSSALNMTFVCNASDFT